MYAASVACANAAMPAMMATAPFFIPPGRLEIFRVRQQSQTSDELNGARGQERL